MKKLLFLLIFFLVGCSTKNYILPSTTTPLIKHKSVQIGVKEVEVPEYLLDNKFIIEDGVEAKELNVVFVESLDRLLTKKTIDILKESLNNPNVFLYPWEVKEKKGYIISIKIDDFKYSNGKAILKGSYKIYNVLTKKEYIKNFRLTKTSKATKKDLVMSLNGLYKKVVLDIAQKI